MMETGLAPDCPAPGGGFQVLRRHIFECPGKAGFAMESGDGGAQGFFNVLVFLSECIGSSFKAASIAEPSGTVKARDRAHPRIVQGALCSHQLVQHSN